MPALTACDVSKDSSTSPPETLVPTPIVRTPNLLEATDIEMLALNEIVDPLRPNPDCASAETELTRREERKDLAIQGSDDFFLANLEPKTDSTFPKSKQELDLLITRKIEEVIQHQKTSQNINQLVIQPIAECPPLSKNEVRDIVVKTDPRCSKAYSLAHLKVGLHATPDGDPSWQYALVDSGCNNNLISLNALKHLADFNKAEITQSSSQRITTANNDSSQVIEGKIKLLFSVIDTEGKRICLRSDFLIVSGLTHDIFLGSLFLNSPQINHITRDALFFNPSDCFADPHPTFPKTSPLLQEVMLTHHLNMKARVHHSQTVPANSAIRILTTCVNNIKTDSDTLHYFQPAEKFHRKFPSLHIMQQTIVAQKNKPIDIMIINTSTRPVKLRRNTSLGHVKSNSKTDLIIESLNAYVSEDSQKDIDPKPLSELNTVKIEQMHKDFEFVPVPLMCNHAFTSHMHDHPNTPEQNEERKQDFKNLGYFQKTVSETLDESKNIPSLEYTGKDQFKPKSDSELLKDIDLSHLTDSQRALALGMLKRNITAFQRHPLDIGCCKGITAFAPLNTPNPPILYAKYVPIPLAYKKPAQKLIDEYCAAGVLAPTNKPCRFTSNIFIIPKKDGTFRLIFDGRILSKYCQQLPIALGNFDEIFSNLTDKSFVSKLDLSKAYDQLAVDEETSQLLSFFGPDARRYVYKRSGQGLKFSSFFLNQAMDNILFGMSEVHSYCDDVFITGDTTFEQHLNKLEEVIKRFQNHNVKLNIAKLEIAPQQLDFLGLTWSRNKLSIPKSKITAYTNLKEPKSIKEARFLVNSLSFYRRFIPKFSDTIHPILELIKENDKIKDKKKRSFNWTKTHQNAVSKLVKQIENGMSIYLPRKDRMFIIHTDASYVAAAATVSQVDDEGHTRLVAAVSRTFNRSERHTAPVHKEILSLLYCLTSLNYILRGHFLRVFADAKSLTLLKTCSTSSPYLSRLAMELSIYDFELFHLPGKLNIETDALSRMTKTQDKILSNDKQKGTAMTKDESLLFLEYLTIPTDHHFTQNEVRQLLTSEPLRTELKAKVKTRIASAKKTKENNGPHTVKSKKTKQPRYVRSHPLESNNVTSNLEFVTKEFDVFPNTTKSPPLPLIPQCEPNTVNSANELFDPNFQSQGHDSDPSDGETDSHSDISEDEEFFSDPAACERDSCLIHAKYSENKCTTTFSPMSDTPSSSNKCPIDVNIADIYEVDQDIQSVLTDSDRHWYVQSASAKISETLPTSIPEPDKTASANENENIASDNSIAKSLSAFDHHLLAPTNTIALNNSVGVHNVRLSDSLAELDLKSNILTSGQLTVDEFKSAQELDPKIQELRNSFSAKPSKTFVEHQGILCKKSNDAILPVLPQCLEKFLFNCEHFHILAGHRSAKAIITELQNKFHIFQLKQMVQAFCSQCFLCCIAKPSA